MKKILYKLLRTRLGQWGLAKIGSCFIRLVYWTNHWTYMGRENIDTLVQTQQPALFCFWHGRMAMMPCAWQWKKPFFMLLSHHADGQLISRVIGNFGIGSVYGSTNRRGEEGARDVLDKLKNGAYVGITPDGPRGPGYKVSPGIIRLAQMANVPIIPTSHATSRRKIFRSWDRFHLPLMFGKGTLIAGEPIWVTSDSMQEAQQRLEDALQKLTEIAEARVNKSS